MIFSQRFVSIVCLLDENVLKEKHTFQMICGIPASLESSFFTRLCDEKNNYKKVK